MSTPTDSVDLDLWQAALATEHAVIWSYGMVGATPSLGEAASQALTVHRSRRAECLAAIAALGSDPVASAPAYDVERPAGTVAARRLAVSLEQSAAAAAATLAGATDRAARLRATQWLRESAVAQVRWGADVSPLPGFSG